MMGLFSHLDKKLIFIFLNFFKFFLEYPEDIHPYATFVLPEGQCHSSVGTIGHQDMLILHETPTLPMSDKSVRI